MDPLTPGQNVTYTAADGSEHPAVVLEAYGGRALVSVPDLHLSAVVRRLQFERQYQDPPWIHTEQVPQSLSDDLEKAVKPPRRR